MSRVQRHESESVTDFLMLRLSFSFLDLSRLPRLAVCSLLGSVLVTHAALTLFFSFLSLSVSTSKCFCFKFLSKPFFAPLPSSTNAS